MLFKQLHKRTIRKYVGVSVMFCSRLPLATHSLLLTATPIDQSCRKKRSVAVATVRKARFCVCASSGVQFSSVSLLLFLGLVAMFVCMCICYFYSVSNMGSSDPKLGPTNVRQNCVFLNQNDVFVQNSRQIKSAENTEISSSTIPIVT